MAAVPDTFLNNLHGTIGHCQELEQAVGDRLHSLWWQRRGQTKIAAKSGDVLDGPPLAHSANTAGLGQRCAAPEPGHAAWIRGWFLAVTPRGIPQLHGWVPYSPWGDTTAFPTSVSPSNGGIHISLIERGKWIWCSPY